MVKAGVVVVVRFCNSSSKQFSGFIDYLDKEAGKKIDDFKKYNLFNDYMDKPDVSSGLFTATSSSVSQEMKDEIKNLFSRAQENDSLMWQTVISFDNQWLEEQGLYNISTKVLDEEKIKEISRGALKELLDHENLSNAVWSASIHYDTDNIHIHVAIVEPQPMREKKQYQKYDYISNPDGEYIRLSNGAFVLSNERNKINKYGIPYPRYDRIPVTEKGSPLIESEYVGKFKQSSINACKKYVIDHSLQQRENNLLINRIIRDQIVKSKKTMELAEDHDLAQQFIKIHKALPRPENGNRGLWRYNMNIMEELRPEIDKLSEMYMRKYHSEEMSRLMKILNEQSYAYKRAYGETGRNFEETKLKELYERMGNAILSELRDYDRKVTVQPRSNIHNSDQKTYAGKEGAINSTNKNDDKSRQREDKTSEYSGFRKSSKNRALTVRSRGIVMGELQRSISLMKNALKNQKEKYLNEKINYENQQKESRRGQEID